MKHNYYNFQNRSKFGITPLQLTSQEEESQLLNVAHNHTHTAYLAQSLLFAAKGHEFPIELPHIAGLQGNGYTAFKAVSNASDAFTLYPNPATHTFNIASNVLWETATLYNLHGKAIVEYTSENTHLLLPETLQNGMYIIQLILHNGQTQSNKLVISK